MIVNGLTTSNNCIISQGIIVNNEYAMINTYDLIHIVNFNKFRHFIIDYTPETQKTSKEVSTVLSLTILISELLINDSLHYLPSQKNGKCI